MIPEITKLVSLILGISVASDRLITLIKSIFPSLAAPPGSAAPGPPTGEERKNRVILIAISFGCCLLTTILISYSGLRFPVGNGTWKPMLVTLIALMATGGSSFWTNILGYLSALKDVANVKALKGQADFEASQKDRGQNLTPTHEKRTRNNDLKTVTFAAAFTDGPGTLIVKIDQTGDRLEFKDDGSKDLQLPTGEIDFTISGEASPGPQGGVTLTTTGERASNSPYQFGPGAIQAQVQTMLV